MDISLLGSRHVEFNGLHLPGNTAVGRARLACVPLHAKTGNEYWPITNMGSGILYARKGRNFVVFTKHQLQKWIRPSDVVVRLGGAATARLNHGARFLHFADVEFGPEEFDVCAIEMPWRLPLGANVPLFLNSRPSTNLSEDDTEKFFAVGYPSKLTRIDGDLKFEHIGLTQVLVWASGIVLNQSDLPMLTLMQGKVMIPQCDGDFDGFSGGPVFGVSMRTRLLTLRGIIIRGGIDKLFFAPLHWIDDVCDKALQMPALDVFAA